MTRSENTNILSHTKLVYSTDLQKRSASDDVENHPAVHPPNPHNSDLLNLFGWQIQFQAYLNCTALFKAHVPKSLHKCNPP